MTLGEQLLSGRDQLGSGSRILAEDNDVMATIHKVLIAAGAPQLKKNQFYNLRGRGDAAVLVIEDNNDHPAEVRVIVGSCGQTKKEALKAVVAAAFSAYALLPSDSRSVRLS